MRIIKLHPDTANDYCCNIYWVVAGTAHARDRNTLVDVGSTHPDTLEFILREMARHPKGIGRPAVEQVVLTHFHYDHVGGLLPVIDHFQPEVCAFREEAGVQRGLRDGAWLRLGDKDFRVLHTPGHSEDSICLFCPETRDLFSGDTLYRISDTCGSYPVCYVESLQRLKALQAATIYPGHGEPVHSGVDTFIDEVLANVQASVLHP